MTETNKSSKSPNRTRKWLVTAAIAGGVAIGATGIAGAVSSTTAAPAAKSGTAAAVPSQGNEDATHEKGESAQREADEKAGKFNFGGGDHGGHGGPGGAETVVTGADADKANAAALASVPGKVSKTERRADGTFEVEITKADGTEVHVMLDKTFKVTGQGGHGGHGGHHHDGTDGGQSDGEGAPN